jgi:hypothetical protein
MNPATPSEGVCGLCLSWGYPFAVLRLKAVTGTALKFFPTFGYMALLTSDAKLAIMHVFTLMARNATAAHVGCVFAFRCFFLMAAFTSDLAVSPIQYVLGAFVVVEIPQLPGSGVMAIFTAFT